MAEKSDKVEKLFVKTCRTLGRPLGSRPSKELESAVDFLEWELKAEQVIGTGKLIMLLSFAVILAGIIALGLSGVNPLPLIFCIPLSLGVFFVVTEWPKSLAKQKALVSLNRAPYLIAQICAALKQTPNLENVLEFVTRHNRDRLTKDMKRMLWLAWTSRVKSVGNGIKNIGEKWGEFSEGFKRAVLLINSSSHDKTVEGKIETLDKAVDVILNDITNKMREYATSLHIPTLILFSIGTIVPLMVISLFPVVSFFGFQVSQLSITAFLVASLVACYVYSDIVLKKRPVALDLSQEDKKVRNSTKAAAATIMIVISIPSILYLTQFLGTRIVGPLKFVTDLLGGYAMVWGAGLAVTLYAYKSSAGLKKKEKEIRNLESRFIDTLYHIRNRLSDGKPFESALEFARDMASDQSVSGYIGNILNWTKRRGLSIEESVSKHPSDSGLVNFVFTLLLNSLENGQKAATQTADVLYNYLNRIKDIEKDLWNMLNKPLTMMKATVLFFAPFTCGIIIVIFRLLSKTIESAKFHSAGAFGLNMLFAPPVINPTVLQLIVGLYTIALNYVLIRYISRIQFGPNPVFFRFELAKAVPVTLIIFTATVIISGVMLV